MRRASTFLFLLAVLAIACSPRDATLGNPVQSRPTATTAGQATPIPSAPSPTREPGAAVFDAERAIEHVRLLSVEIGERVSGTDGEAEATAYIASELRAYGYEVETEEFEFAPERFGLSFVDLPEGMLTGFTLEGSDTGEVSGEAVYVGLAQQPDVDAVAVAGKVAIVDRGSISFQSKYLALRDAGAVAIVIINNEPGSLLYGNLDTSATFPVVAVAQEDGPPLMVAAEAGATVTVRAPDDDTGSAINVLARAPGDSSCELLVGGHHDTVPAAPGANDNASGVAHVLELARLFAADGLDTGLCFATFGAEEHGLFGSAHLAQTIGGGFPQVMVNLDVTGTGSRVEVIGDERLRDLALAVGTELQIEVVRSQLPANAGSDHQSFAERGAEVAFFTSGEFATIHTPGDTFDAVEIEEMDRIGRVAALLIERELARIAGD